MTTNDAFDATLNSWLDDEASAQIPSVGREHLFAEIVTRRRRPGPLAGLGSHWIADPSTRAGFGSSRRVLGLPVAMLLLPLLALALLGATMLVAGSLGEITIAPPVPDGHLPSNIPVSTARVGPLFPDVIPAVGRLTPGTYSYLDVDGSGVNAQFTVPDGWSWDGRSLRRDGSGPVDGAAIMFFGNAADVEVYVDPCRWSEGRSAVVTDTVDGVVTALTLQPSRNPTLPPNPWVPGVNVPDSSRGLVVDLIVPAGLDITGCDEGEYRSWTIGDISRSHEGRGQRDSVSIIDIYGMYGGQSGPGGIIIDAASFPNTSPTVMAEIDAIVDSIVLGHWG